MPFKAYKQHAREESSINSHTSTRRKKEVQAYTSALDSYSIANTKASILRILSFHIVEATELLEQTDLRDR